jgi:hypothetical protein
MANYPIPSQPYSVTFIAPTAQDAQAIKQSMLWKQLRRKPVDRWTMLMQATTRYLAEQANVQAAIDQDRFCPALVFMRY